MRLAEEPRDVGGQRRHHLLALVRAARLRQERAIIAERLHSEDAEPLDQARIDQGRLGIRDVDPGIGMQHRGNLSKIFGPEDEFTFDELAFQTGGRRQRRSHAASLSVTGST